MQQNFKRQCLTCKDLGKIFPRSWKDLARLSSFLVFDMFDFFYFKHLVFAIFQDLGKILGHLCKILERSSKIAKNFWSLIFLLSFDFTSQTLQSSKILERSLKDLARLQSAKNLARLPRIFQDLARLQRILNMGCYPIHGSLHGIAQSAPQSIGRVCQHLVILVTTRHF